MDIIVTIIIYGTIATSVSVSLYLFLGGILHRLRRKNPSNTE